MFLAFAGFQANAKNIKGFTITGNIKFITGDKVFLTYGTVGQSSIDSVIIKKGSFIFKGSVSEPTPAMIFSRDYKVRLDLFIDNGTITITGNADSLYSYRVKSKLPAVMEFEKFNQGIMANRQQTIALFKQAYDLKTAGDTIKAAEIQKQADTQYKSEFEVRKNYALTHADSYVAGKELLAYTDIANLAIAIEGYENMTDKIKNSLIGKELFERINILTSVEVGKPAQLFKQTDTLGNLIDVTSYRGKYVLLEFWASWCGPCRAENPGLIENYKQYNNKGFEILSISLDDNKDKWLAAIAKDGLLWKQVSDLNGWNNKVALLYGVRAVPASFLLDPQGKIVASGLRGESLTAKLKEIFP